MHGFVCLVFAIARRKALVRDALRGCVLLVLAGVLGTSFAKAQSASPPKALTAFEQLALLAFNPGGKLLSSITLNGTATWTAGSLQETGSVVLKAGADGLTSETWTLPSQSHGHAESSWSAGRSCSFTDKKGVAHAHDDANCMRAVSWFAPWSGLGLVPGGVLLSSDATQSAERANGLRKLAFQTGFSSNGAPTSASTAELAKMETRTAVDVTFDQKTALPMSLDFEQILDSDPAHTIQYQIVFSDFRSESGLMVPHRIQRYMQRTLQADITITTVTVE